MDEFYKCKCGFWIKEERRFHHVGRCQGGKKAIKVVLRDDLKDELEGLEKLGIESERTEALRRMMT